jgi:hypothetical protein
MAIKWESYRNRKRLDPVKWSSYLSIETYEALCDHLLKMGITPPERSHPDVLMMMSAAPKIEEGPKPTSGRDPEKDRQSDSVTLSPNKRGRKPKPTSGRAVKKTAASKPKQARKRVTRKTSLPSKKTSAKK